MKNFIRSGLLALFGFITSLAVSPSASAATLNSGDVVITGFNVGNNTFSFAPLVDLPAGTTLSFTDRGWSSVSNAFNPVISSGGDGTMSWTCPSAVPAGTHFRVTINPTFGAGVPSTSLTITNLNTSTSVTGGTIDNGWHNGTNAIDPFLATGDGLFIYQDVPTNPFFIFGFNNSAATVDTNGWNTVETPSATTSKLPNSTGSQNSLTAGVNAVGMTGGGSQSDNAEYTGDIALAPRAVWLARLATRGNWTESNSTPTNTIGGLALIGVASSAPTVTTATQSAVTHNSATLGGNVTADGGASVSDRGIVWGLASNPTTTADTKVANGSGTGAFSATVNGLPSNTLVHVRAYATNSVNTGYGNDISFTTNPAPVAITSLSRVDGTPTNAGTVNWTLTFASAVTGVTASNFTLTGPAAAGLNVGLPTTSNNITWNIPVNTGSTDGLLTLNLANATGLSTAISTTLPFAGDSYTIDKTPPTVLSVVRFNPSPQTTNNPSVVFRVTYSEPVALNLPEANRFQVVPVNGSNIVGTVTGVTGSGNIRDVTVNRTSGTGEFKLRVLD